MSRWEAGTTERLQAAALELFAGQGFEETTAAEIAQSVGLTERTFFRHFADKREVLFHGQERYLQTFLDGIDTAPPDASPLDIMACTLAHVSSFFADERRPHSRLRQSVIDRHEALREREVHKRSVVAATVAAALHERGVTEPAASLAGESTATVFGIAFIQWIGEGETRTLGDIADSVLHGLRDLGADTRDSV